MSQMGPVGELGVSIVREKVRRRLDGGESAESIRAKTEELLVRRLSRVAADDPARAGVLNAHAILQRVTEETIQAWQAEQAAGG